jgi:hypothetical protein
MPNSHSQTGRRFVLLEPPLVMLALDRIEALREEAKTHWLISLARSKSDPKPQGWLERFTPGFRPSRTRGGDARVNPRAMK